MSLNDPFVPPSERDVNNLLDDIFDTPEPPQVPEIDNDQREYAALAQENDPAVGGGPRSVPIHQGLGLVAPSTTPKDANEAIGMWQERNVDMRPTPDLARRVTKWANARTMELFMQAGLLKKGQFSSTVTDDLIQQVRGGFMYVGAGTIGDITPADATDAANLALDSYTDQVIERAEARLNEIIANNIDPRSGAGRAGATRRTLTPAGQAQAAEMDAVINAATQIKSRRDDDSVQGAFFTFIRESQRILANERATDAETMERLKLGGDALAKSQVESQDVTRQRLSMDFLDFDSKNGVMKKEDFTGPERLVHMTGKIFDDVEDPNMRYRMIEKHFDRQVNRARAQRMGGDPSVNHVGALFQQFPNAAINMADAQVQSSVIQSLDADTLSDPLAFQDELLLAREEHLETHAERLFNLTQNLDEELKRVETRESISFVTDAELAVKQGVGNLFEVLSAAGTGLRQAVAKGGVRKLRGNLAQSMVGEAALEAMQRASKVVEDWEDQNPDAPILLEDDFSNLRASLIQAERAGEMPYSLRKSLFSDDPNDMVANAAVLASDVMAPSTVLRMVNNGFGLDDVRAAFKDAQDAAFREKVLTTVPGPDVLISPQTLEELTDKEQALTRNLAKMNPLERPTEGFSSLISLAQVRAERGWKELALSFVQDPKTVFDTVVGVVPIGIGAGVGLKPINSFARKQMVNAGLHTRLTRVLSKAARFDPNAVHQMRKQVDDVLTRIGGDVGGDVAKRSGKQQETLRAMATTLEQIDHEHKRLALNGIANGGAAGETKRLTGPIRRYKRLLRQLGGDEIKNFTQGSGLPLQMLEQVQSMPSPLVQGISRLGEKFSEALNIDGKPVEPWVTRNAAKVARTTVEALENGAAPAWEGMPFSLDAAASKPTMYQRVVGVVERATKDPAARIVNASGEYARTVAGYVARKFEDTLTVRHLQAQQAGNQVDFLSFMKRKYEGELHDLELASPSEVLQVKRASGILPDPEELAAAEMKNVLADRIRRVDRTSSHIDQRRWDTRVNLADDDIVTDASDADLIMWARNQAAAGNDHEFWVQNRLNGESFGQFFGRISRVMAGQEEAGKLRASIARRYLNAPGLSSKQKFDTTSGMALTPQEAKRLRNERSSTKRARQKYEEIRDEIENFQVTDDASRRELARKQKSLEKQRKKARFEDPDFTEDQLGDNLGLRTENLKEPFNRLVRLANTEDSLTAAGVLTRAQDMTDGRITSLVQTVRDSHEAMLNQQRALSLEVENFQKRFRNLDRGQQNLFNAALAKAQDTGDMRALRVAGDADPKIAALLGTLDKDKNKMVVDLLDQTNHFRENLLRDMRNSGLMSKEQFDSLVGGYAAQLYSSGEHAVLLKNRFGPNVFQNTAQGGLNMSEFLRQQHHVKHKAIVSVKGGRSITHLFDDAEEATDFLVKEYGLKGDGNDIGQGAMEFETQLGDSVVLMEPLGKDRARALGFLRSGPSTFLRLETLVRDMTQARLMQTLDRPGWTMAPKEYKARVGNGKTLAQQKTKAQFEQLTDSPDNGPLRGKWVHKGVARIIRDMNEGRDLSRDVAASFKAWGETQGIIGKGIVGGSLAVTGLLNATKQAIVTNKIARSLSTPMWNFVMDSEMFGVTAAGRDFSFMHPRGLRNKLRASKDLTAWMRGKETSAELLQAARNGVIDDTIFSHSIDPNVAKQAREMMFGTAPSRRKRLLNESRQLVEGVIGKNATTSKLLDKMLGESDDPQVLGMQKRLTEIERLEKRGLIDPKDMTKIVDERVALEAALRRQRSSGMNSMRRAWHGMWQTFVGDRRTGTFEDVEPFARELYGVISNINRLGAYYHLLENGVEAGEAVRRLNTFMQNYSRVPQALRDFGQSPFGSPVVAFPYEQMRIMMNTSRYKPGMLLGFMGGNSAANFMSMVAAGQDPYKVYQQTRSDSAGFPGFLAFASTLMIPHADGTGSTLQLPALNWWQPAREPFGVQAKMFGLDDSPEATFTSFIRNGISKFAFSQPALNTAYAGLQHRDPKTGQVLSENDSFLGRAAKEMAELFIPSDLPFIGSAARQIAEGIEKPSYVRSGREVGVFQRALQSLLGIRLRGWLGTDAHSSEIGEGLAKVFGVNAWTDIPIRGKTLRGFDDRDVLSQLFVASRAVNPSTSVNERLLDEPFKKVRKARDLLESDDPREVEAGKKLRDVALEEFESQLRPFATWHGQEFQRTRSEQEKAQFLERAYRTQDFDAQFDRLPVDRKVAILLGGELTGINESTIRDLFTKTKQQDTGELKAYSSLAALKNAKQMVARHISNPPRNRLLKEFRQLDSVLDFWIQEADLSFRFKQETDAVMRAVSDQFYGVAE